MKNILKRYLILIIGAIIIAFAFNIFLFNKNIIFGDIIGLSILSHTIYGIDTFIFIFSINMVILALGYSVFNEKIIIKAIPVSIILPIAITLLKPLTNIISIPNIEFPILVTIASLIVGLGYGLIHKAGFNFGGVDLLSDVISCYTKMNNKNIEIIINIFIITLGGFYFGLEAMIYGTLSLLIIMFLRNRIELGINDNKTFYIITDKVEEVKQYIINTEKKDITIFDVQGGYKNKNQKLIMCVLEIKDYYRIQAGITQIDPNSFITITDSYESINPNLSINGLKTSKKRK